MRYTYEPFTDILTDITDAIPTDANGNNEIPANEKLAYNSQITGLQTQVDEINDFILNDIEDVIGENWSDVGSVTGFFFSHRSLITCHETFEIMTAGLALAPETKTSIQRDREKDRSLLHSKVLLVLLDTHIAMS